MQIADDEVDAAVARVVAGHEQSNRRLAISGFGDSPVLTGKPAPQCEADAWLVVNDQYVGQLQLQNRREGKANGCSWLDEHPFRHHPRELTRMVSFGNSRPHIRR